MELEKLYPLVDEVEKLVYRTVLWVSNNTYNESFCREDMRHDILTSLFETSVAQPSLSKSALVEAAAKKCKSLYTGKNTAYSDQVRRRFPSVSRAKAFVDIFDSFGAKQIPAGGRKELYEIYEFVSRMCGHEVAILYVLHIGYKVSISKLVTNILGITQPPEYYKQEKRIYRTLKYVTEVLNKYVSREGRKLFDIDG